MHHFLSVWSCFKMMTTRLLSAPFNQLHPHRADEADFENMINIHHVHPNIHFSSSHTLFFWSKQHLFPLNRKQSSSSCKVFFFYVPIKNMHRRIEKHLFSLAVKPWRTWDDRSLRSCRECNVTSFNCSSRHHILCVSTGIACISGFIHAPPTVWQITFF